MVKINDLRSHSWKMITSNIKSGRHPKIADLARALRRGEADIPIEAQTYIAGLLDRTIVKRGRPKKDHHAFHTVHSDYVLMFTIEDTATEMEKRGLPNPLQTAINTIATKRNVTADTIAKYYRQAKARTEIK